MVVLTTAVGFLLAASTPLPFLLFVHTLLGTSLVASGASALNQVLERGTDAQMQRTARRPLPSGRLGVDQALFFAVALSVAGLFYLAVLTNLLTAAVGALSLGGYVFVYTPMKRRSSLSTLVGAVPGALPPMMGCAAAANQLDAMAWTLFAILFLWQMPHFLAIAWLCKEDYRKGGFPMLTVTDDTGHRTARQMILYAAALVPVSLLPSALGSNGLAYFIGALVLALVYLGYSMAFSVSKDMVAARRLLLASVLYLPAVLLLMVVERAFI